MVDKNKISVGCSCCSDCEDTSQFAQANNTGGCSCGSDCCSTQKDMMVEKNQISIDFLYLDLSVCSRCQGTDISLEDALSEVSKVLEATGVDVIVNKINVTSEDLATKYKFISSPTIRVNGRDIQMDIKESLCESCGDLCGDEVDCRIWIYQGKEYTVPPKAMIIEAILKEVYGKNDDIKTEQEYIMPENLKKFYAAMNEKNNNKKTGNSCCSSSDSKSSCC